MKHLQTRRCAWKSKAANTGPISYHTQLVNHRKTQHSLAVSRAFFFMQRLAKCTIGQRTSRYHVLVSYTCEMLSTADWGRKTKERCRTVHPFVPTKRTAASRPGPAPEHRAAAAPEAPRTVRQPNECDCANGEPNEISLDGAHRTTQFKARRFETGGDVFVTQKVM